MLAGRGVRVLGSMAGPPSCHAHLPPLMAQGPHAGARQEYRAWPTQDLRVSTGMHVLDGNSEGGEKGLTGQGEKNRGRVKKSGRTQELIANGF